MKSTRAFTLEQSICSVAQTRTCSSDQACRQWNLQGLSSCPHPRPDHRSSLCMCDVPPPWLLGCMDLLQTCSNQPSWSSSWYLQGANSHCTHLQLILGLSSLLTKCYHMLRQVFLVPAIQALCLYAVVRGVGTQKLAARSTGCYCAAPGHHSALFMIWCNCMTYKQRSHQHVWLCHVHLPLDTPLVRCYQGTAQLPGMQNTADWNQLVFAAAWHALGCGVYSTHCFTCAAFVHIRMHIWLWLRKAACASVCRWVWVFLVWAVLPNNAAILPNCITQALMHSLHAMTIQKTIQLMLICCKSQRRCCRTCKEVVWF